jgi:DNA-binding transcriptional LysR family regulator
VSELENHACLAYSLIPNPTLWEFMKDGHRTVVKVTPRLMCNNAAIEVAMAVNGIGIGRIPLFCCEQEIAEGTLEIILDDYEQPEIGVYAVYPHRQYLTAKVRAFVDFLVEKFES